MFESNSEEKIPKNSFEKAIEKPYPQGKIDLENESQFIVLTNGLQVLLSKRLAGEGNDNEIFLSWKNNYSEKFREVFRKIITENPCVPGSIPGLATKSFLFEKCVML